MSEGQDSSRNLDQKSDYPPPQYAYPPVNHPPQEIGPEYYNNNRDAPNIIYEPIHSSHQQPAIVILTNNLEGTIFGNMPVLVMCKNCKVTVTTRVENSVGCMVWIMFIVFYIISPCVSCIPFCIKDWYDKTHLCPKCMRALGQFSLI